MTILSKTSLLIRTDESPDIGSGHAMRCLALAQAWNDAGEASMFLMSTNGSAFRQRLDSENVSGKTMHVTVGDENDCAETIRTAQRSGAKWIVLDGYHFGGFYQRRIKEAGLNLLCIDDNHESDYYFADIVLNQNVHATTEMYSSTESFTRLLLGPEYALLRREFLNWKDHKRELPEVARRVLVTLGGSDPLNLTVKVIQALKKVNVLDLEAVVVVGTRNPHRTNVEEAARQFPSHIRVETNVQNMPELMAWADLAISGAGSTCLELAFMGLPALILIVASNQENSARLLNRKGIFLCEGSDINEGSLVQTLTNLIQNRQLRENMLLAGKKLVDGNGPARVISVLNSGPWR